ncbi:MAG: cupin domain-containing protein [Chloroflexi bacterium]|nr:cupin domain-containing protein [Chloroflexota bacterium]
MEAHEVSGLLESRAVSGRAYLEFQRSADLSTGLYVLPAGGVDPQDPHTEDEIYVVHAGRAMIQVGGEDRPVRAGSVVFVAAGVEHRFHTIEEELAVVVVFGPAEGSRGREGAANPRPGPR